MTNFCHSNSFEVAFVSTGLADRQTLINAIRPDVAVVDLDEAKSGLLQILDYLYINDRVAVLHLVTHGSAGRVELGNVSLTQQNLFLHQHELAQIGALLGDNPEIHIYGCEVGAGQKGADFVRALSHLTSVSVAASTNLTGSLAQGGDWDLELEVGIISAQNAFVLPEVQAYSGVLVVSDENFDGISTVRNGAVGNSINVNGWTYTSFPVTSQTFYISDSTEFSTFTLGDSADLNGANDRSLVFNYSLNPIQVFVIKNSSAFKLDSFDLAAPGTPSVTIYGFLGGNLVFSEAVNLTANDSVGSINYTKIGADYGTLYFGAAFQNIDEIRLDFGTTASPEIDNLNVSTAVVPPAAPSAPDMTAGTDSGNSSTDNITNNPTPTFTGTAEANSTVRLYDTDGTTQLGSTTADGSGNWSITSTTLSAGAHTITATATDASNNTSSASSGLSVTIDTAAPPAPSAPNMTAATDSGTSVSDDITNDTTPTFLGTAEAYASITLFDTDGSTVLGTTTANGAGNWIITSSTLSAGTHVVFAQATDTAGNVSALSSPLITFIDTAMPTVSTINRASASPTNATSVDYTVSFDENVSGVDTSDFSLTGTGTATGSIASVTQVNASTYTITANSLSGNGTLRLDLNSSGTGITDTAGNAIATGFTSGQTYTLDNNGPAVTSVSVPANATYAAGQNLDFTVNFDENVTVNTGSGTPYAALTLDTGGSVQAAYLSGSGTSALVFRYTVQVGDADLNGVAVGAALTANGGTIRDAVGNDATLTLNSVSSTAGVLVDGIAPTVSGVTSSTTNGTYTVGDTISVTVNFSESVTVTGTPQLTLETGAIDRTIDYVSGSGTSALTFNYTVQVGDASSDLDYIIAGALSLNGGTIRDAAGNNATLTLASPGAPGSLGNNKALVIDTSPTITSATYDASTGVLVVTGTNLAATAGANNDIDVSQLTLRGGMWDDYTLTSSDVEITNSTSFSVTLNSDDQLNVNGLLNKNGTSSVGGTTFNLAGAAGWNVASGSTSDTSGNGVSVTNVTNPTITSATFDALTGVLTVSGANLVKQVGATNDITVSTLTITGEGGSTYTLTSTNVEITSGSSFSVTLNATDLAFVKQILNKNGTSSTSSTTYNLAAADDWNTVIGNTNISDTSNAITVSNVAVPTITSATYDGNTGVLVVTGSGLTQRSGANNDIVASKFTLTGEANVTYTLTDTADVDIASGTSFTLTLSATDKAAIDLLLNKNGTSSTGATTYNLSAAEDWAAGADSAVTIADTTGNGITVSNAVDSTPPSAPSTPDMSAGTDSGSSSSDNITNNTTPTFSGTAEANATVRLYDTDGTTQLGSGTADGSGNWTIITSTALSAGAHTITAKATDASNNTSVASSGLSITVDSTAPVAPSAPDMTSGTDTGVSNSDDITNDTTPTFTGTSEANASVTMYDTDGTTVLGTTTADGSGNWSMTSSTLSAGNHTLTTKATDVAGNVSSASSGLSISIDTTAPAVSTINRVSSALTNATSVDYTVSFAEAVYGVDTTDFSLTATGTATGSVASVTQVNANTFTITANTLTGDGTLRLDLKNSGTGITDTAGNAIATGFTSGQTYTLDNTGPAVTSVAVPSNTTYNAGHHLDFTVNFGENVTVNTTGGTPYIALTLDTGGAVQASYLSGSGTAALVFRYTVQSGNADANGIAVGALSANGGTLRDAAGNDAALTLNSVGSTAAVLVDAIPPTTSIASAAFSADTGTSTTDFITATAAQNISGTLSANLAAGESVEVSLDNGATWTTATTTLGQNTWSLAGQTLVASNTLKVRVSDVDGSGPTLSQAYVLDITSPTLQSTTPADNATAVAVAANVVMSFDGSVNSVAGKTINLYKAADNSLVETIAVNDGTKVGIAGGVVTINPTTDFSETTGYYVLVDSGAFTDMAGNVYGGITSTTDFNFTTLTTPPPPAGNEAPTMGVTTPLDDATDVAVDAAIVMSFSEAIKAGSGNIVISNVSAARSMADVRTISVNDPQILINGRTLTIDLADPLQPNSAYHVLIDAGALTDLAGMAFNGITNPTAFNFVTASGASVNPLPIPDDLFLMQLYRDILYREADTGGLSFWTQLLEQNLLSRESVAEAFISSNEFQEVVGSVARLYFGTFDRMPDQAGLSYWVNALRAGASLNDIGKAFIESDEFVGLYGTQDGAGFLGPLYNHILNREADLPGLLYWQTQLEAGVSKGQVLTLFTNSPEYATNSLPEITATLTSLGLLGTLPDQNTLDTLVQDVTSGTPLIEIIGTMLNSPEYHDRFL